mmetsp:Transcript_147857/g.473300  ORF Transcript_147857/g.473300 Transcript_147857/m.473300 type:complete len:137 (+) Transcript_147857:142-552(+)
MAPAGLFQPGPVAMPERPGPPLSQSELSMLRSQDQGRNLGNLFDDEDDDKAASPESGGMRGQAPRGPPPPQPRAPAQPAKVGPSPVPSQSAVGEEVSAASAELMRAVLSRGVVEMRAPAALQDISRKFSTFYGEAL